MGDVWCDVEVFARDARASGVSEVVIDVIEVCVRSVRVWEEVVVVWEDVVWVWRMVWERVSVKARERDAEDAFGTMNFGEAVRVVSVVNVILCGEVEEEDVESDDDWGVDDEV